MATKKIKPSDYVANPFENARVLSLCPGLLGLERGLARAIGQTNVIAYVEIEAFICENLLSGMRAGLVDEAPVWTDLKTFDARPFYKKIHIITGGYPCQPFSTAGKRKGKKDPRHLWPFIHKHVLTIKPVCCFFENVSGHLSMGYDQVYRDLSSAGYAVETGIFTAEEIGAPHERERLFILAIRKDFLSDTQRCYVDPGGKFSGWQAWSNVNWSSAGPELADPESFQGGLRLRKFRQEPEKIITSGNGQTGSVVHTTDAGLAEFRDHSIQVGAQRNGTCHPSPVFPDTNGADVQGSGSFIQASGFTQSFYDARETIWPSGPGKPQYEWEHPRVASSVIRLPSALRKIWHHSRKGFKKMLGAEEWKKINDQSKLTTQSGVGCSVDGYNFREDLLRSLGNSVVEDQSERAFVILLKKHIQNLERSA